MSPAQAAYLVTPSSTAASDHLQSVNREESRRNCREVSVYERSVVKRRPCVSHYPAPQPFIPFGSLAGSVER